MTSEELFSGVTRTVATTGEDAPFGDDGERTVRGALEEDADGGYHVEIERGAPDTDETPVPAQAAAPIDVPTNPTAALVPLRVGDGDDWTEHKLLPDQTRKKMQQHARPERAAGAIDTKETKLPPAVADDDAFKSAVTAPSRMLDAGAPAAASGTPASGTPASGTPAPASAAAANPDAALWIEADAPTRAYLELPDLQARGAVYHSAANPAGPDEATRVWDPAIALARPPEWTFDARMMARTLRARLRHAWATRPRLVVLIVAVVVAASVVGGVALRPLRARPMTPLVRPQPRRPPSLHPTPVDAKATPQQDLELLIARAVVAYDTGRRIEAAEMFHTLVELQPEEPTWQFMADILDRANNGSVTP